jgi:predicted kinase
VISVVIVGGPPASGKSTTAAGLAAQFDLPLIAKDEIKERLLDELGSGDLEWSRSVGRAAFALVWHCLEVELAAGRSCIVEVNFGGQWAEERFRGLADRYEIAALQIHCFAAPHILRERYSRRSAARHPDHMDRSRLVNADELLKPERYVLRISGDLIRADTSSIPDPGLLAEIRQAVAEHLGR